MKRSNAVIVATPNRRSLIRHNHALLNDPEVVAFLDNTAAPMFGTLVKKLINANEPELLIELVWTTQSNTLSLCMLNERYQAVPLPDGLLDYLLQHMDQIPCVHLFIVQRAVLSTTSCTLMQTVLADPACTLTALRFLDCSFADAHVQFPLQAATVQSLHWYQNLAMPGALSPMDQMLSALPGWHQLKSVSLFVQDSQLNFATITQMLVHNPNVIDLSLECEIAPLPPGDPAYQPQQDLALLLDSLMNNQVRLTKLELDVRDGSNAAFNQHFIQRLGQCLMSNVTLESLRVPGIQMCTPAAVMQFRTSLDNNHGLISLWPLGPFGHQMPPPVRRNDQQRYWFTSGFVLGAAEAFLRLFEVPTEIGKQMAQYLAPTPAESALGGAVMSLICQSTHESAVNMRSAGLREAAKTYIHSNDSTRCRLLLGALVRHKMDLLPADKQELVEYAKHYNRLDFLPPGYAH
ncbi:hypothetical protein [Hydrogenophaga sp.]|uniref:hypothetical protein n=1 Tax=Hydrogenophaga sp. TaxID=1904254 RepID=UPI002FCBBBE4